MLAKDVIFLVACTRLNTPLCWSVGMSVGPSVALLLFRCFPGLNPSTVAVSVVYLALFYFKLKRTKRHDGIEPLTRPLTHSLAPFPRCGTEYFCPIFKVF